MLSGLSSIGRTRQIAQISCFKSQKISRGKTKATKKVETRNNELDDKDVPHMIWWKEVCYLNQPN